MKNYSQKIMKTAAFAFSIFTFLFSVEAQSIDPLNKHTRYTKHIHNANQVLLADNTRNTETFDKERYLDLHTDYNYTNEPTSSKSDNAATTLLKDVGGVVHSAIGSTDSDNVGELGDKITTGITNHLKNQAINKTEALINDKANQLFEQLGSGRSEISINGIQAERLQYEIKTIQPLSELNKDSRQLTFLQAQFATGENHGSPRNTFNLGIGQRYLLDGGRSIVGFNLFTDYESKSDHNRASLGLKYQRTNFSTHINRYYPLSARKNIGEYTEEVLEGHDIKLMGQIPYLPWAKVKGTRYFWKGVQKADIKGTIFGVEIALSPSSHFEFGTDDKGDERSKYMRLSTTLPLGENDKQTQFFIADQAFQTDGLMDLDSLNFVERSNKIHVERVLIPVERALRSTKVQLGKYSAKTENATCTLTDSTGTTYEGKTNAEGLIKLSPTSNPSIGLVTVSCSGGNYTNEAEGTLITDAPTLRAAINYTGGDVTIFTSPLSELAYQLAGDGASGTTLLANLKDNIAEKNKDIATAFGIEEMNILNTLPTDLNADATDVVETNSEMDKFAWVLASISTMYKDKNATDALTQLIKDHKEMPKEQLLSKFTTAMNNCMQGHNNNDVPPVNNDAPPVNYACNGLRALTMQIEATVSVDEGKEFKGKAPTFNKTIGTLTYTLGGDDASKLSIDKDTGVVTMVSRDFETAVDANNDNNYQITIIATSNQGVSASATQTIKVINIFEGVAIDINATTFSVDENAVDDTLVGKPTYTGGTISNHTITAGNTDDVFKMSDAGEILVNDTSKIVYSTRNKYTLTVKITGDDVAPKEAQITININPIIEGSSSTMSSLVKNTRTATNGDAKGITQTPSGALTVSESGITQYTLKLNTQPKGSVTITPISSNINAATVSGAITFTRSNWLMAQTITITGVTDTNTVNEQLNITYTANGGGYTNTDVSTAKVTVTTIDNTLIDSQALGVDGNLGVVSAAESTLIITGSEKLADGTLPKNENGIYTTGGTEGVNTIGLTFQPKDSQGNPLTLTSGTKVILYAIDTTDTTDITMNTILADDSESYTAELKNTNPKLPGRTFPPAKTITVQAKIAGSNIGNPVTVHFVEPILGIDRPDVANRLTTPQVLYVFEDRKVFKEGQKNGPAIFVFDYEIQGDPTLFTILPGDNDGTFRLTERSYNGQTINDVLRLSKPLNYKKLLNSKKPLNDKIKDYYELVVTMRKDYAKIKKRTVKINVNSEILKKSTLTSSLDAVPYNGTNASIITLTLIAKDYGGKEKTDFDPVRSTIAMSATGSATVSTPIYQGKGVYTAMVTNTTKEAVIVSAKIAGREIDAAVTVNFKDIEGFLPTVSFERTSSSNPESTTAAQLVVKLSSPSTKDIVIAYITRGGATAFNDYTTSGTLTIKAGDTQGNITLNITDDDRNEPNETIIVAFSSITNGVLDDFNKTVHTYTIKTDDASAIFSTLRITNSAKLIDGTTPNDGITGGIETNRNLTFTFQPRDFYNNPLTLPAGKAILSSPGAITTAEMTAEMTAGADGSYTASLSSDRIKDTIIEVKTKNTSTLISNSVMVHFVAPIAGSGLNITKYLFEDHKKSTYNDSIVIPKLEDNITGQPTLYKIVSGNTNTTFGIKPDSSTLHLEKFLDYSTASYNLKISLHKDYAESKEKLINIKVNPEILEKSSLTVGPTHIDNGINTATITLTLIAEKDNGAIKTDFDPVRSAIAMSTTGSATISPLIPQGKGVYTATITNAKSETVTISATIAGKKIKTEPVMHALVTGLLFQGVNSSIRLTESGGAAKPHNFTVRLKTKPEGNVGMWFNLKFIEDADKNRGILKSGSHLGFTPSNWYIPQAISVVAVNNEIIDGSARAVITASTSSYDASYDNLSVTPFNVTVLDDEFNFSNAGTLNVVTTYGTTTSPVTGRVWLDRNLGAKRVATSISDSMAYGDYFQWGRSAYGHEKSSSSTEDDNSDITNPNNSDFYVGNGNWLIIQDLADWTNYDIDDDGKIRSRYWMYGGSPSKGAICPLGYEVPTELEFKNERAGYRLNSIRAIYKSFLKMPAGGYRDGGGGEVGNGAIKAKGEEAQVWTRSFSTSARHRARGYRFADSRSEVSDQSPKHGFSIRCIRAMGQIFDYP